ncbi:uncharacterized protein LOC133446295 [Cololabis saira]|uniref:uncharacterized protein LOC133446295 n=1 Tax=Cololabis saira TaxID=129043 RepID=UPI002AD283EB|nr:uncharacterized protein LOC133446295 [Cololabis saira]
MNKDLVQKNKSDCTSNQEEEACSSSATHSSAVENNTKNNKSKRSLSPDNQPPRKRRRVSEAAGSSTSYDHEEKTVRVAKRKAREDGERPKKRAKRGNLLKLVLDQEVASSSTDTGSNLETHTIPEVAGSSTSYNHEEKTVRVAKRKAREDGERPKKRAKRVNLLRLVLDQEVASSSTDTGSNLETQAIPEVAGSSTSYNHEEKTVRVAKRKAREDGERPKKRAKRVDLLRLVLDQEVPSSSTDTGSNLETKAIPGGDRRKKKAKRKADDEDAEETSGGKKKKKKKTKTQQDTTRSPRDEFQEKYEQQGLLGEGACGSVFAGYRKSDHLQVAIKHVQSDKVVCKHKGRDGREVSVEVAAMLKLQEANSGLAGQSAPVSLLDWYDLDQELILVMERPMPSEDLCSYIGKNGGPLEEDEARIILKQLLDAAVHLQANNIFHRDIKLENILIETGSSVPRVRLIDFGLSCFFTQRSRYRIFCGNIIPPEWLVTNTYTAGPTTTWQMGVVLYDTLHNTDFPSDYYHEDEITTRDDLSADCQDFLHKCFILNPKQRPSLEELQRHPWLT